MGEQIKQLENTIGYLISDHGIKGYSNMLKGMSKDDYLEEWKYCLQHSPLVSAQTIPFSLGCDKFRLNEGKKVENQADVSLSLTLTNLLSGRTASQSPSRDKGSGATDLGETPGR